MKIQLLGWKYKDIRKFENLEISLSYDHDNVIPITMIMMRNGTGKTTTLMLLRAIFSGKANLWGREKVRSYRPQNREVSEGSFSAKVRYILDDGSSKVYRYILHLDYETGQVYYETSYPEKHGGLELGYDLPPSLEGVINNEEFVNRFIFDGEQARKTLSSGNKEAEEAIIYLYQLNRIDDLVGKIRKIVKLRQEKNQNGTLLSVKNHKTRMEKAEENWRNLCKRDQELRNRLNKINAEKSELERKYLNIIAADDSLRGEQEKLTKQKLDLEAEIQASNRQILEAMKNPYNLHPQLDQKLKRLATDMVALKLPKSTSQEFFEELASTAKVCICGRDIGSAEKAAIRKNAEKYLGEEQLGILNAIKHTIREYETSEQIDNLVIHLEEQRDLLEDVENGLNRLSLQAEKKGNHEIGGIRNKLDSLQYEINMLTEECEYLETKDYVKFNDLKEDKNIEKARKRYEEEKLKYEKVTNTYKFSQQSEKMITYLEAIKIRSLERLKDYIIESTNDKINRIITNDQIKIKAIDQHIRLLDREQVSAGQELSVAYAYIGTLFEHAHHEFPFIIDSPAGAMDLEMGREVAEILPKLFKQMVMFVTSREVPGFAETFYLRDGVRYLTIIEQDGKMQPREGIEFFSKYQTEDEGGV
ncbi:AAA family ATPase [Hungatella hathewayi]|uniref:AAA family ATPase n=1 Tax=Hungatella hathewayi TaxID=154046 RepID=UPI0011DE2B11|nr:AAA family ATPase [Hungatella hathewayi]